MKEICERDVVSYLVKRVEALGGEVRKVKWIGRKSAPDLLVMWNTRPKSWRMDKHHSLYVEAKRPGKDATAAQAREHVRMRGFGLRVEVINSLEAVDRLLG
jgi:hypothetical protein